jgi:enediyne biosynthesis protein E4
MVNCQLSIVNYQRSLVVCLLVLLVQSGCRSTVSEVSPDPQQSPVVHYTSALLASAQPCTGAFVPHILDHTTTAHTSVVALYESNGAGVAINDLDGDGNLDIVLANLAGPNTILWNRGDLRFETQPLDHGDSRAVNIIDVDGDGLLDIVFTRRFDKPTLWRNTGQEGAARFVQETLPGVHNPFYSMAWADLNGNGALELVAASYDTELRKQQGAIFDYRGGGVGVFVYTRQGDTFVDERLAREADALAILLADLNDNGQLDIVVGNDFDRRDYIWLRESDSWTAAEPFRATTENTMSFDLGDIHNDGSPAIFAADMKPYRQDVPTLAQWLPIMDKMTHPSTSADPQRVENVLQVRGADGRFRNQAYARMVDATGWSWSAKFGDLDNDGFLDLYVVNGMIAEGLFSHLDGHELVEENQAFRNDGRGHFVHAPEWGLGSLASGRGMMMADLNNNGRLDIVINNLMSPAILFENQLCGGSGLAVDLRWPASQNPYAIGAQLALHTDGGVYYRDVRTSSGYLSGDPARIHFGLPDGVASQTLEIRWPDGAHSTISSLSTQTLVTVYRQ